MTIFNARETDLNEVTRQLRALKVNFDRIPPSNSLEWLFEHQRDFTGFALVADLAINQDAVIFLRDDALLREDKPHYDSVGIMIRSGIITLTMKPEQVSLARKIRDGYVEADDPEWVPVFEVIFKA